MPISQLEHDEQLRKVLFELLSQTTKAQQDFFEKLYPMGLKQIPYGKLNWAIQQCQRTIQKNKLNAGLEQPSMDELMNDAIERANRRALTDEEVVLIDELKEAKKADIIVSITKTEVSSPEELKVPITKAIRGFSCVECGETNPDMQYLSSEYCHICINK